ncbi:hypothetical protein ACFC3Z_06710 [Enterococcus thailandicus]|uniref:hypothetical protein n=1 Tax=Enterococcus thailandicus TaxID=417368 RepID=UPI0035DDDA68
MQKFLNWLEKVLTPLAKVIGENKYLVAIRDGFLLSTPLLIVYNRSVFNDQRWLKQKLGGYR